MRVLNRNCRPFYYAPYLGSAESIDNDGNYTGENPPKYGERVLAYGNISSASGMAVVDVYGYALDYDKTIIMSKKPDSMTEQCVLWVDDLTSADPDYIVRRVNPSLNYVSIAIKRVSVS